MRGFKHGQLVAIIVAGAIAGGCGEDAVAPNGDGGNGHLTVFSQRGVTSQPIVITGE